MNIGGVTSLEVIFKEVLRFIGLDFLTAEFLKLDTFDNLRLELSFRKTLDGRVFHESPAAARQWLLDLVEPWKQSILSSPVVQGEIKARDGKIKQLEKEAENLQRTITALQRYKHYVEIEQTLRGHRE